MDRHIGDIEIKMPRKSQQVQSAKITDFFTSKKTTDKIDIDETPRSGTERYDFYSERALKTVRNRKCKLQKCVEKKNVLAEKIKDIKEKRDQLKTAINICADIIKKKESKINFLRSSLVKTSTRSELVYTKFKDSFTEDELAILRSIDDKSSSDSSFVLACVRSLYKNDLNRLKNISVTGRSRFNQQKVKMSPQKMKTITSIFEERLSTMNLKSNEKIQREKRMNTHIKRAILNTNSKRNELEQINAKINATEQTQ